MKLLLSRGNVSMPRVEEVMSKGESFRASANASIRSLMGLAASGRDKKTSVNSGGNGWMDVS